MSEFNFKSSVCTSREQSERLLALGLKKETADMFYSAIHNGNKVVGYRVAQGYNYKHFEVFADDIPAWSLHRLWELANIKYIILDSEDEIAALYDEVIMKIEQLISEWQFNKEYLQSDSRREQWR